MFDASTFWGLDLGGGAVKGVRMVRGRQGLQIAAADAVRLQGEPAAESALGRDPRIYKALTAFRQRNKVGVAPIISAVPARATFLRALNIVLVGGAGEESLVRYEVQQHIKFGLDAIVWDYQIFPQSEGDKRARQGLLVALKKESLNNYLLTLSAGRMQADDIQCAPLALYNFVRYEYEQTPQHPFLIMDIGASCTDIIAVDGDRFDVQTLPVGGNAFTKAIQDAFKLPFDKAETIKRNLGKSKHARHLIEALLPSLRGFANDLRGAVQRFETAMGRLRFRKVYLFGGAARTVGMERLLADTLECEVQVPTALKRVKVGAGLDAERLNASIPILGVALGLALQGAGVVKAPISLITTPAIRLRQASRLKPAAVAVVALLVIACAASIVFARLRHDLLMKTTTAINKSIHEPYNRYKYWMRLVDDRTAEDRLEGYRKLGATRVYWLAALNQLANMVNPFNVNDGRKPKAQENKLWLMNVRMTEEGEDHAKGMLEAACLMRASPQETLAFARNRLELPMQRSGRFTDVKMTEQLSSATGMKWGNPGTGSGYFLFRLEFTVPYSEPKPAEAKP